MLKLNNQIRLNTNEAQFIKDVTGLNSLPTSITGFDNTLEHSARAIEDGTAEGRLLAGLIRLSKSIPDELEAVPDTY